MKVRWMWIVNVVGLIALAVISENKRTVQFPILALIFANGLLFLGCLKSSNRKLDGDKCDSELAK